MLVQSPIARIWLFHVIPELAKTVSQSLFNIYIYLYLFDLAISETQMTSDFGWTSEAEIITISWASRLENNNENKTQHVYRIHTYIAHCIMS